MLYIAFLTSMKFSSQYQYAINGTYICSSKANLICSNQDGGKLKSRDLQC